MRKRVFTFRNISNVLFFGVILLVLFNPATKVFFIQSLMKIGLFQPDISVDKAKGDAVPDMVFSDIHGKTISLSSLKGKVVFINFWATWCPPCRAEMPGISQLHQQLASQKNIVFIMIDADDFSKGAEAFVSQHHYSLPLYKLSASVPQDIFNGTLPTTVIIDQQGNMIFHHEGIADYSNSKFQSYLVKLANQ
ncbi:TlpA disulfide reductase family protein [Mucilaginibacter gossypii]|uniref:TlpA family protein disulfide reductase n=1 Tax=Mucilaginibacter gossypii TaxID=551996 RepID=UPI000DCDEEB4|nr:MULTISPECIES: TlpA disulfide reductase family protein [Mucilaginibacter]QTE36336.1 TlpA disulfide reductase family protein [Mucilaginibacter gossypii]RAV60076.1 TlpA family protein disulfide reductase [Mucilaginibacter rubeus]